MSDRPRVHVRRWVINAVLTAIGVVVLWYVVGPPWCWYYLVAAVVLEALRIVQKKFLPARDPAPKREAVSRQHERVLSRDAQESSNAWWRLVRQFVGGMFYMVLVSLLLAGLTEAPVLIVLAAVTSGIVFTGVMMLVCSSGLSRSAEGKRQFGIQTLLFVTTATAVYLGVIRLLADLAGAQLGETSGARFLTTAVICLIMTGVSLPILARVMESMAWLAAWLVRRPSVRRWLRRTGGSET